MMVLFFTMEILWKTLKYGLYMAPHNASELSKRQVDIWSLILSVLHKYGSSLCPVLLEAASLSGQPIDSLYQLMTLGSDSQDWWAPVEANAWNELVLTVERNIMLLVLATRTNTVRPVNV